LRDVPARETQRGSAGVYQRFFDLNPPDFLRKPSSPRDIPLVFENLHHRRNNNAAHLDHS
jgi:hypothetical protein